MFIFYLFYVILLIYIFDKYGYDNINFIILLISFIILIRFKKTIENFSTDSMRFIPCSDSKSDLLLDNNYKLEKIPNTYSDDSFFSKLYKKPIQNMFHFPDCNLDNGYNFQKSFDAFFDRKIFTLDSIQQKSYDQHNLQKDLILYNNPFTYRSPLDLETKLIPELSENDFQKYQEYLDFKKHSTAIDYTTCGNIDNKGNRFNCKFPRIFNHKNTYELCESKNDNCKNVCCVEL